MKKTRFRISDRALVDYLRDVVHLDVESVRTKIGLAADMAFDHPEASSVTVDGVVYELRDDRVVAVTPVKSNGKRHRRVRRRR